jgi:signal transduction histidine kinase
MLADDPPTDQRGPLLERVRHTSLELLEMINATLDLSRIASGKDIPRTERVELRGLWATLSAEFAAMPRTGDVVVRWHDPGDTALVTDQRKLARIMKNLVGNALKFTATGEVTIACAVSAGAGTITVRDTGIGIPKEGLPFIFEMFRQVDSSDSRSYSGAGLGLYIVQRLVTQLGGSVDVESTVGRGSMFRVTLPLAPSSTGEVTPAAAVA